MGRTTTITTTKDEEKGLLTDGADPGYGTVRLDLCYKQNPLQLWTDIPAVPLDSLALIQHVLNERIPPICANGMQRMVNRVIDAAIEYAAEIIDAGEHPTQPNLQKEKGEKKLKRIYDKKNLVLALKDLWTKQDPPVLGSPVKTAIMLASIWFALMGYNIGILNVAEELIFPTHSMISWAVAVAAFSVGGYIGSYIGMPVANKYGRCPAFYGLTILFLIGGIFQALAPDMAVIQASRIVLGIASGMASTIVPVYLGEIAPPQYRGKLGGMLQRSVASGILVSFVAPFLFEEMGWRAWVSVNIVLPLIPLVQIYSMVESPLWMLKKDPTSHQARRNLARARKQGHIREVELEALSMARPLEDTKPSGRYDLNTIAFKCSALQVTQQLTGVYAIFYYSNTMMSKFTSFRSTATLLFGFAHFLATAIATRNKSLLESNISRRQKLIASEAAMFACAVALRLTWGDSMSVMVLLLSAYVGIFALIMHPLPKLVAVEELDGAALEKVNSLQMQVGWAFHALVAFAFPFLWLAMERLTFEIIIWIMLISMAAATQLVHAAVGKTPKQYFGLMKRQRPVGSLLANQ